MADSKTSIVISARDETRAAFQSVESGLKGLDSYASKLPLLGGALATAFGAVSFTGMIKGAIDAADHLNDLSQRIGVGVEQLAGYKYVAEQSGTSLETVAKGFKKLSVYMAEHGGELKKIGINAKDADEGMLQLADVIAGMPEGVQRTALAAKVLGEKLGPDLIPMLNEGGTALKKYLEEGRRLNPITTEMARQADQFNDQMHKLGATVSAVGIRLANDLLPFLNDVVGALDKGSQKGGLFVGVLDALGTAVRAGLGQATSPLGRAREDLDSIDRQLGDIQKRIDTLGTPKNQGQTLKLFELQQARDLLNRQRTQSEGSIYALALENQPKVKNTKDNKAVKDFLGGAGKRDEFADLLMESSGLNKDFHKDLNTLEGGLRRGRIGLDEYTVAVEKLIAKQPFAVELTRQQTKAFEQETKALDEFFKEEEKARLFVENYIGGTRIQIERAEQAREMIGLRERDRQIIEATRKLEDDAAKARRDAFRDIKDPQLYQQAIDGINASLEKQKKKIAEVTGAVYDYAQSWEAGVKTAVSGYLDEIEDMASKSNDIVTKTFRGMEDALVDFVKTGKLDFKSLADSIITDIIRIQVQQTIMKPLASAMSEGGGLFDIFGKIFGGGGASDGGIFSGLSLPQYATGTPWVPQDGPAFLHKGEAVVPAEFNRGGTGASPRAVSITNHYTFDSRTDQGYIMQAVEQMSQRTRAQVIDDLYNNRGMARAVRSA